ncbi:uncharacterized protein YueI [Bacillus mesophilus]|uniref:Uncharacterized protein n=1 Tax=Bacillus mesophilus TaxID=1808955 RepID=A0A6M0QB88_9BACI|nr:hypothetical protein [Bacillus mesophilus]MBM7663099.1 uncharacterized protein YueI [Bacillus mesophilus]NEY73582.1 hypothetical protein [Bacillus mesophilus]
MEKIIMEITQNFENMNRKNKVPHSKAENNHHLYPQSDKQDPLFLKIQLNYELIEEYLG